MWQLEFVHGALPCVHRIGRLERVSSSFPLAGRVSTIFRQTGLSTAKRRFTLRANGCICSSGVGHGPQPHVAALSDPGILGTASRQVMPLLRPDIRAGRQSKAHADSRPHSPASIWRRPNSDLLQRMQQRQRFAVSVGMGRATFDQSRSSRFACPTRRVGISRIGPAPARSPAQLHKRPRQADTTPCGDRTQSERTNGCGTSGRRVRTHAGLRAHAPRECHRSGQRIANRAVVAMSDLPTVFSAPESAGSTYGNEAPITQTDDGRRGWATYDRILKRGIVGKIGFRNPSAQRQRNAEISANMPASF